MIFTKFHENRLIIDGEINEKHALLVINRHSLSNNGLTLKLCNIFFFTKFSTSRHD